MKITKRQLRRIINEASGPHPSTPDDTSSGPYRDHFNVTDVDNGRPMQTSIYTNYGMVTVSFGNSFVLHIDSSSAQELGAAIQEAGLQLEDSEAGRNPGGSIG